MRDVFRDVPATMVMDYEYEAEISGLSYNTDYYYACCVETEDKGELSGGVRKFTHMDEPVNEVVVETMEAENIERYRATVGGKIFLPKGVTITRVSLSYGTDPNLKGAETTQHHPEGNKAVTDITWNLDGLQKGTKYYYQVTGHFEQPGDDLENHINGKILSFTTESAVNPIWVLENTAVKTPVTSISVKTGESLVLDCVNANNTSEDIYVSDLSKNHGSYITATRSGNKLTIKGVSACTNQTLTLTYKVEGASHTTSITYTIISTDEKRRQDIRDYFFSRQSEETLVDFTISPEPVAKYIVSNNGVMVLDSHRQPVNSDYPEYNYRPVNDDTICCEQR